ncbi:GntR family transcriptional regulator [Spirochaetia bacterium 38H-sp]|uniref:GntR family transcriptional regulator n=1 Tax=Rarispira pelagica TaxID=3141764 RepID=A0ABU9UDG0_9SPIR
MDFESQKPIYIQIADLICERILRGKYVPGGRIPSIRDFSVELEVNPNTVFKTYSYLQSMGIIMTLRGRGFFVSEDGYKLVLDMWRKRFLEEELPDVFKKMRFLKISFKELKSYYDKLEEGEFYEKKDF